ncbi:NTPase KAP family P-loop domain-containing protein 1 [Antennarius striatus]|uniref:NTPase KAP family P-loop domain-containing protein 1 n=1 Tax=Antennarius striatus TaxID=241820 RepID=UPI0035B48D32
MSQGTVIACKPTKDDIYAYALAKTLTKVSSPATVGLYSACQNRLSMILEQIEVNMKEQASTIQLEYKGKSRPRSVTPSICDILSLILRLLFYRPIWTKNNQQQHNVRFIYVHFSAWHFAGSDLLWAGLAIRLLQAMQVNFGKLQLVLYRLAQHDEEEEVKKKILEDSPKDWRPKMVCCCPLWFLVLSILVVPIIIMIFLLTFELPKPESGLGMNGTKSQVSVPEGLLIAALGVPAATSLKFVLLTVKNLIVNLDLHIKKGMDNKRVSSQLGFMNQVRKEMWFLSRFIDFMEVFERRKIRIVLKITDLDRCSPKKIVAVLNAINILLSNDDSPFISILAVNPSILVQKINFADGYFCKEERAYELLNCIVTLAFTVPPLCDDSKCSLFYSLTKDLKVPKDMSTGEDKMKKISCSHGSSQIALDMVESNPLIDRNIAALNVKEEEEEEKVEQLLRSIFGSNKMALHKYILDDSMSMRRVINSIRITVIIMKALKKEHPQPELVAAWVVLVNQWPCRLSWIIQCVEDAQQRDEIDGKGVASLGNSKTLWKVFCESRAELYLMSAQIEDLLGQDGDPEMFEKFLKVDFQFTIQDLMIFEVATVNLDHTIKMELAQIRGTSRLKDSGWMRNLAPLPVATIIKMDIEDVCKELEKMKFPSKYVDTVRRNGLSGLALVFCDPDDLKDLLDMTVGEWATFRLHFLGIPSHLQPQYKNMLPKSSHFSSNQLPRLPLHVAPQYWSNPSLANS